MQNIRSQIQQLLAGKSSKAFVVLLRARPDLLDLLNQETDQYMPKNFSERLWILFNGPPPCCSQGNKRQFNTWEKGYRKGCVLGNRCWCVAQLRTQNQKITLKSRYGVDTVNAIPGVAQKRKLTNQTRYGVDHPAQNSDIKKKLESSKAVRTTEQLQQQQAKRKQTCLEKYGADHHMKTVPCLEKQQQTNLDRYGVKRPLQNKSVAEKSAKTQRQHTAEHQAQKQQQKITTLLRKYSVVAPSRIGMSAETLQILDHAQQFRDQARVNTRESLCEKLKVHPHTVYLYSKKYSADQLFLKPQLSLFEKSVREYVMQYQNAVYSDRSILNGKELDIFVPDLNLAIECSGLYWHSEISSGKPPGYHADKYQQCKNHNIRLVTIWEDQWNHKRSQSESRLKYLLKSSQSTVSARQCTVQEISSEMSADFQEAHHIQGSTPATHHIGLMNADQLMAVMTFRRPRFSQQAQWEIIRFATLGSVPGAAGKMFSYFVKQHAPLSVISYCDHSWGHGGVYEKMGFQLQNTQIGYWYTDYKYRYNRMQFQKSQISQLVQDGDQLSEWQIMQQLKYDRIWDCGQSSWIWRELPRS